MNNIESLKYIAKIEKLQHMKHPYNSFPKDFNCEQPNNISNILINLEIEKTEFIKNITDRLDFIKELIS